MLVGGALARARARPGGLPHGALPAAGDPARRRRRDLADDLRARRALNRALESIGLGALARPWLGDFTWALPAIGFVGTWVMSGLALVLFMAGVQKIPQSLYDAARVDGAGPLREFFAVTLPNLRGEIAVALTLTTIAALRNFDLVYITTQGGPGDSTSVPAFQVYNRAFQLGQIGSAAAIGLTLALRHLRVRVRDHAHRGPGTDVIARRDSS